jgi:hypothetical protein
MSALMKAIRVHHAGGPEVLQIEAIPIPTPRANWAWSRSRTSRRR